jgi:hypothetical protein
MQTLLNIIAGVWLVIGEPTFALSPAMQREIQQFLHLMELLIFLMMPPVISHMYLPTETLQSLDPTRAVALVLCLMFFGMFCYLIVRNFKSEKSSAKIKLGPLARIIWKGGLPFGCLVASIVFGIVAVQPQ